MIVRYSIEIKQKNKTIQKIKDIQNDINIPKISKDILKKLSIHNLITPAHTTLAELKRNQT